MLQQFLPILPIVAKGLKTGFDYFSNHTDLKRRQRALDRIGPYDKTAEGSYLQKLRTQGAISPQEQGGIIGRVAQQAGGIARQGRQEYLGRVQRRMGTSGSIAFEHGAGAFGRQAMKQVGDATQKIALENTRTKAEGERLYAFGKQGFDERKLAQQEAIDSGKSQASRQLAGGLLSTAASGFSAYMGSRGNTDKLNPGSGGIETPGFDKEPGAIDYFGTDPETLSSMNDKYLRQWAKRKSLSFEEALELQDDATAGIVRSRRR